MPRRRDLRSLRDLVRVASPRARRRARASALAVALVAGLTSYAGAPAPARACYVAYQYRVFPLGVTDDHLIAVVFSHRRFSRSMKGAILRGGDAELVEMSFFGEVERVITSERVEFPDRSFIGGLRPALARAQARAMTIDGFTRFAPPTARFCDYEGRCAHARWTRTAAGQLAVSARVGGARGDAMPVVVPEVARDEIYESATSGFSLYPRRLFRDALADNPFLFSSVRAYQARGRTVFVVHAGSGQFTAEGDDEHDMVTGRLRALPVGACRSTVASCAYNEPTPHHGSGFDIVLTAGAPAPEIPPVRTISEDDYGWTDADHAEQEERERREEEARARARREREAREEAERARLEASTQWPDYGDDDDDDSAL